MTTITGWGIERWPALSLDEVRQPDPTHLLGCRLPIVVEQAFGPAGPAELSQCK